MDPVHELQSLDEFLPPPRTLTVEGRDVWRDLARPFWVDSCRWRYAVDACYSAQVDIGGES